MTELDFEPSRTLVVGDRLDTDILMAQRAGVASCLALSGCCSKADLETSSVKPDFVIDSVGTA
ncbi:4-nitrophenylphosphatase, putative [Perkinsus marinus ATCC 50983]|uniref:4-nitrophenylphosphatase, putative n=1 Tax=Perkinsus marinus (strain ATCC 50983 / TXsc) TaxID=423536 RepID=C5L510_PERM5|nr:4-nitrophenylphosphatase, putative [Perkinsus marinus ATCC 50983]EER08230.1 4-nitrophenylphosphatase, putative [Perkinsus marinus ATCC 50983]|eukprot:XP_002776414.1 4-nitrophenylphosphatase, putative [Perkinsus marinus ATCC 50983]